MSVDEIEKYLMECIQKAVDKVAKDSVLYLTQYIMDHWYAKYSPKEYYRTFNFVQSASKTDTTISGRDGKSVVCMLFFDTDKIKPRFYGPEYLNPHANKFGASTAESIPRWIERGAFFYGRGKTEGLGSMQATMKMLEREYPKRVQKELEKMGLKVTIS